MFKCAHDDVHPFPFRHAKCLFVQKLFAISKLNYSEILCISLCACFDPRWMDGCSLSIPVSFSQFFFCFSMLFLCLYVHFSLFISFPFVNIVDDSFFSLAYFCRFISFSLPPHLVWNDVTRVHSSFSISNGLATERMGLCVCAHSLENHMV